MAKRQAKESSIQRRVANRLRTQGCHVEVMSCNAFQKGIPDLYVFHPPMSLADDEHHFWVDVKRPKGGTLTKCQCQKWPVWDEIGIGIWILTGEEPDPLDFLLDRQPNWREWWRPRYDKWLVRSGADILEESNCEVGDD